MSACRDFVRNFIYVAKILAGKRLNSLTLKGQKYSMRQQNIKLRQSTERENKYYPRKPKIIYIATLWVTNSSLRGEKRIPQTRPNETDKHGFTLSPKMGKKRTKEGNGRHIWLECFKGHGV